MGMNSAREQLQQIWDREANVGVFFHFWAFFSILFSYPILGRLIYINSHMNVFKASNSAISTCFLCIAPIGNTMVAITKVLFGFLFFITYHSSLNFVTYHSSLKISHHSTRTLFVTNTLLIITQYFFTVCGTHA